MRKVVVMVSTLLGLPLGALPAQQSPGRLELAASAGHFTVSGWELHGMRVEGGWGCQVALRYRIWRHALLEVGGHWSRHDLSVPDSLQAQGVTPGGISVWALYVQPTVRLGSPASAFAPFVGLRFGGARWDGDEPGNWDTGLLFGGVVGVHLRASPWIAFDAYGSYTRLHFGGGVRQFLVPTRCCGTTINLVPMVDAHSFSAQAGLALHLPWLGR
jgi:hypothetical protein